MYKPPYKSVEVIWNDAASNSATWVHVSEVQRPEQVNTRGWLVHDEPDFITIASSVSNEDLEEDIVGNTMTIPRGMIVSIKELRVVNVRNRSQDRLHAKPGPKEVHREPGES